MNDNIKIDDVVVFKPGKSFIPEEELSNNKFVVVGLNSSHVLISFKDIGIIPIERERVEIYKPEPKVMQYDHNSFNVDKFYREDAPEISFSYGDTLNRIATALEAIAEAVKPILITKEKTNG